MTSNTLSVAVAADLTLRPATLDDATMAYALMTEVALKLVEAPDEDLAEIVSEWTEPGFNLKTDTLMAFDAQGKLAAYAIIYVDRPMVPYFDLYLHPDRWDTDTVTEPALLAWAVARAKSLLPLLPEEMRSTVSAWSYAHDERYIRMLTQAGLTPSRHSLQMRIDFDGVPQPPAPLDGITIRAANETDSWPRIVEALADAWRDHRGYIERPLEERIAMFTHEWMPIYVPGAWLLAMDGDTIAGMSLCNPVYAGDPAIGTVYTLAVRRPYRRRGVARALMLRSFVMLHEMGRTGANLWVDAASLTGATKLYEGVGMRPIVTYTQYTLELRAGIDPSVQSLSEDYA